MITIRQWGVYLVDLNPPVGTKPGKTRPVIVVQPDALNEIDHPSTVILPITSQFKSRDAFPLRVFLPEGACGLEKDSVILVDQIVAWDNRRFVKQLGQLPEDKVQELESALKHFFGW